MDESETYILAEAVEIARRNGKLDANAEERILNKVKTAKLENSDYEFLSIVIKATLISCYNALLINDEERRLSKKEKYMFTVKKLEIEALNKALDIVMDKLRAAQPKRNVVLSLFLIPFMSFMFTPMQIKQIEIVDWLTVVLAFVSIIMLIYAIIVVRAAKRYKKLPSE